MKFIINNYDFLATKPKQNLFQRRTGSKSSGEVAKAHIIEAPKPPTPGASNSLHSEIARQQAAEIDSATNIASSRTAISRPQLLPPEQEEISTPKPKKASLSENRCNHPKDVGPCSGRFTRW